MSVNKRIYYAIKAVGIAECGTSSFATVHGAQQAGMTSNFNLQEFFELGQLEAYSQVEGIPTVELTIEKALDGYPLLYHLATKGATSPTLGGRSNKKATVALNFYSDDQDAASGTPISSVVCSGMYLNNWTLNCPVDGAFTESVSLLGGSKVWYTGSFPFTPTTLNNTDGPLSAASGTGGIQRRQNMLLGSGASLFPTAIPGVSSSGTVELQSDGSYAVHLQRVQVSFNLGRTDLLEQGHKLPYFKAPSPSPSACRLKSSASRPRATSSTWWRGPTT
jgi:hypothetical protein